MDFFNNTFFGGNITPLVTPANIDNVTIQYQLPNTQLQVEVPVVFVNFSGNRQTTISVNEIFNYIKLLEIKATTLGKSVIATEINTDGQKRTIIGIGDTPPVDTGGSFTVNTPNGLHDGDFIPVVNIVSVVTNVITTSFSPSIIQFSLPQVNGDFFENDYFINFTGTSNYYVQGQNSGNSWFVTLIIFSSIPVVANFTFTPKTLKGNLIVINNDQNNAGTVVERLSLNNSMAEHPPHQNVNGGGYVPQVSNLDLFDSALAVGEASIFRFNVSPIFETGILTGQILVDVVSSSANTIRIVALGASKIVTDFPIPNTGGYAINFNYDIGDNVGGGSALDDGNYNVTIIVQFPAGGAVPPVGVASLVRVNSGTSSGICAIDKITVYTDDGTVTTGKHVFTNSGLSVPLTGFDFITANDGTVYAINSVTGIVGASTGIVCTPNSSKNVFVVNASPGAISIQTAFGTYNIPHATNLNILTVAEDNIINVSGSTRTFTFLQSMPSTLDPDISPNPQTLLNGNGVALSNDISNLNYIRVT